MPQERLQQRFDALVGRKDVYHAVSVVESLDGTFRWSAAAGDADGSGRPMSLDTPYFIASIDKLYTAVAVLRLVERGRLRLRDAISDHLPSELVERIHVLGGVDRSSEITVEHLLGHTSGLADHLEDRPRGGRSVVERLVAEGDRSFGIEESMRLVREELTPHFVPQPLDAARPKVRYSDTNFTLLIALIEHLHGRPLHEVHVEELFGPLGMRHTWVLGGSGPAEQPAAEPAAVWFAEKIAELPRAFTSLRSVYSTVADQITSLRAIMSGEVFEDPATRDLMQGRWKRFGAPTDAAALRAPSWPIEYGLGMMRFELPRWATPFGRVPPVVGHTGSTGTWLFFCPELELFLAGSVDQGTAGPVPYRYVPKVLDAIVRG